MKESEKKDYCFKDSSAKSHWGRNIWSKTREWGASHVDKEEGPSNIGSCPCKGPEVEWYLVCSKKFL